MASLFSTPGPSPEQQRAQRRQAQQIDEQTADEARQAGRRRRIQRAQRGGGPLLSQTGAAGVRETFGG